MGKKIINLIMILFLFFVHFSSIPVINPIVGEKNISVYLGYCIVIIAFVLLLKKILKNYGKIKVAEFMLITGLIFTVQLGAISGGSFATIWNEVYPFLVPLILYYPIKYTKINQKTLLYFLEITCVIGGIVSLLIANRIIEVDKWAAIDDYVRVAGFVDGTLGTVGFCCSLIMLINPEKKYSRLLGFLGLIGSSMIVLFGLSRLRFVIVLCVCLVIMIIRKPNRSNFAGKITAVMLVSGLIGLVFYLFPNLIHTLTRMMGGRFDNLGTDGNTLVRIEEMRTHMEQLLYSWGMGTGWGVRYKMYKVFVHNVYTGLLMHCGIIFGSYYIYYIFGLLIKKYKDMKVEKKFFSENMIGFVVMLIIILTGFGGAGITQTGAWYGMALVYALEDKEE